VSLPDERLRRCGREGHRHTGLSTFRAPLKPSAMVFGNCGVVAAGLAQSSEGACRHSVVNTVAETEAIIAVVVRQDSYPCSESKLGW